MSKKCEDAGKKSASQEKAKFVCKKCGASAADKNHLCKPEKAKK
ncbi:MAG: hypothetical protein WCV67_02390 [Victivallaceae bacterium]|jgi:hypothetical protein